jgi:hypothetical protein
VVQNFYLEEFEKDIVIEFYAADEDKRQYENGGMAGCLFAEIISRDAIQHGSPINPF